MRFCMEMLRIRAEMQRHRRGCPEVPDNVCSALETFATLGWYDGNYGDYLSADLPNIFKYLRGGATLKIPEDWRHFVPNSLEWLALDE